MPVRNLPVHEVIPLDGNTYVPRRTTALLDAVGRTIEELGQTLAAMAESDRPGQVIVAILTDGLENASQRFSWNAVAELIKQQTEQYKWTFLFLGANQDAIATAAQMSIAAANVATYTADAKGSRASCVSFSRKLRAMRHHHIGVATQQEQADAAAPMSQIVQEEDRKERGY